MVALGVLAGWLILAILGAVVTIWWSRRVWGRRKERSLRIRTVAAILVASAVLGALGTVVGLIKAFGAVGGESVDPSQRARILAEGIAEAMNYTAFGMVVWLPSVVVLFFMMRNPSGRST